MEELKQEERLAYETPLTARIHRARAPAESMVEAKKEADYVYNKYRGVFAEYEDAELFSMLPLTAQQRDDVIKRAREIRGEQSKKDVVGDISDTPEE
jgi:hypothetical protein